MAPWATTIDDIVTDECVEATVYKGAIQRDTNIDINIKVQPKAQ
jgi:hypothetical protein